METIFKVGDHIVSKYPNRGLEKATITEIDDKNYHLKIPCGVAIIPIGAQVNYKLENQD